jgi:uncharacterized membrane protein
MNPADPQFTYMVLILPSLFGLTLVGEGVSKVLKQQAKGWISVVAGVFFMSVVAGAYLVMVDMF